MTDRRNFLKLGGLSLLGAALPRLPFALAQAQPADPRKADYTIEIANGLADIGPDQVISTTLYNGQFPGPLLRLHEGQAVTVDIRNNTDHPEFLHWHGQKIPTDVDGAGVIHRRGPWRSFEAVEFATLEWVNWFNHRRLLEPIGNAPPAEVEARYYARAERQALAA